MEDSTAEAELGKVEGIGKQDSLEEADYLSCIRYSSYPGACSPPTIPRTMSLQPKHAHWHS